MKPIKLYLARNRDGYNNLHSGKPYQDEWNGVYWSRGFQLRLGEKAIIAKNTVIPVVVISEQEYIELKGKAFK